jgi:hypothetical protein
MKHIDIFDDEQSVFVHTDLHMGNILHDGRHLKAVIDFDSAQKAPKARTLISLLGLIDNPQQFVEGTDDFPKYKGKDFYNLLPILKSELSDVFADPLLIQKLNIIGLCEGLMWVAGDWSAGFNEQMIASMIREETPESEGELSLTYHGKILSRLT